MTLKSKPNRPKTQTHTSIKADQDVPCVEPCSPRTLGDLFDRFANSVTRFAGSAGMFTVAVLAVLAWAASGPFLDYSERWQLIINTGTTIVTFLMVFLIQQNQNKNSKAIHLKLDELIRCLADANERLIDVEELDEAQLKKLELYYSSLAMKARRQPDTEK